MNCHFAQKLMQFEWSGQSYMVGTLPTLLACEKLSFMHSQVVGMQKIL